MTGFGAKRSRWAVGPPREKVREWSEPALGAAPSNDRKGDMAMLETYIDLPSTPHVSLDKRDGQEETYRVAVRSTGGGSARLAPLASAVREVLASADGRESRRLRLERVLPVIKAPRHRCLPHPPRDPFVEPVVEVVVVPASGVEVCSGRRTSRAGDGICARRRTGQLHGCKDGEAA